MPMYEYECPKCQEILEVIQKFSDAPLTECPKCQGPISKLMSRTSFQLKGSGWYASDYKKSTSTAPAASKKEESSTTAPPATTPAGGCASGACGTSGKGDSKS